MIRQVRPRAPSARRPGLRLAGQPGHGLHDGVAVRVVRPDRQAADVHLLHRVGQPVHGHVQPGAEQVLVHGPGQAGRDLGGVRVAPSCRAGVGRGEQHAGRLDLELDRAVQVEVPVEAVVVVADRGEVGDHETALAARLSRAVEDVGVLPQDAEILFVDADRVRYRPRLAGFVGHGGVQVGDLAQAVAAELERVGPLADQVLAACRSRPASSGSSGRRRARPSPGSTPGRAPGARRTLTWCRVSPSRASKPIRIDQSCQRSA